MNNKVIDTDSRVPQVIDVINFNIKEKWKYMCEVYYQESSNQ